MTAIPEFILKKLIVQNSFKRTSAGFSFIIRNSFAPGNLTTFSILSDGKIIDPERVTLKGEGQEIRKSSTLRKENPFPLAMGLSVSIQVQQVIPGKKITVQADTREIGAIEFSFSSKGSRSKHPRTFSYP